MIAGIIFDFDGVLIDSEHVGAVQLARTLTELGHPTSVDQALDAFCGVGGPAFTAAVEAYLDGPIPHAFHTAREAEDARVLAEGIAEVAGAVAFVRQLSPQLPRAVASSSPTHWIATHLAHLGLGAAFGDHLYSGREHVARGKPAPDLYLYAARAIGIDIADALIIEDSVVGVTGAVASGAQVVGLAAGRHCGPEYVARLRAAGAPVVVDSFEAIAALMIDQS